MNPELRQKLENTVRLGIKISEILMNCLNRLHFVQRDRQGLDDIVRKPRQLTEGG